MPKIIQLNVSWREIEALPPDIADHRINCGEDALQFGELRLPETSGPYDLASFKGL